MSARARCSLRDSRAPLLAPLCCFSAALGMLWSPVSQAFNLDVDKLTVYSGPEGSYFGYAVDFHIPAARTASVLVGAPKANTSQPDIVEGGAVYYCPWPAEGSAQCRQIPFDNTMVSFCSGPQPVGKNCGLTSASWEEMGSTPALQKAISWIPDI